jgi:hypothetical protein
LAVDRVVILFTILLKVNPLWAVVLLYFDYIISDNAFQDIFQQQYNLNLQWESAYEQDIIFNQLADDMPGRWF